jgi:hypothetical protein
LADEKFRVSRDAPDRGPRVLPITHAMIAVRFFVASEIAYRSSYC